MDRQLAFLDRSIKVGDASELRCISGSILEVKVSILRGDGLKDFSSL